MKPLVFEVPAVDGESIVVQEDELPYFYNRFHIHEQIQITAILEGRGDLITKYGHTEFSAGEIFVLGKNYPHFFKSDEEYFTDSAQHRSHAIHIYFKEELLKDHFNIPEFEEAKRFISRIGLGLRLDKLKSEAFIGQIKNICSSGGLRRLFLFFEFLQYSYFHLDNFQLLNPSETRNTHISYENKARINDIYVYTMAHFAEDITLEKIAKVANMTVPAMCKYFKKSTRKTYMEFLKEVRIDYACKKIIRGEHGSIAEVAYAVGFKSAITFNRAFKNKTGRTPTDYLTEHKEIITTPQNAKTFESRFIFH